VAKEPPEAEVILTQMPSSAMDLDAADAQTVTANYYGKTAVFDVTVVTMSRIVINLSSVVFSRP
jgi:hypothetical protein